MLSVCCVPDMMLAVSKPIGPYAVTLDTNLVTYDITSPGWDSGGQGVQRSPAQSHDGCPLVTPRSFRLHTHPADF